MPPAARTTDQVVHPLPGKLVPGPGSLNVLIEFLPAWRGISGAAAASLQAVKKQSETKIEAAEAATVAAAGTPGLPAAKANEELVKATEAASMSAAVTAAASAGGADINLCATLLPLPPHGPGVVITPSKSVMINNLGACRVGDTILEAIGPPDMIAMGCRTVMIGD